MAWFEAAGILMGTVVALMFAGVPVAFAFLLTDIIGLLVFVGGFDQIAQIIANGTNVITSFTFGPIPLFLLMGALFFHTGLAIQIFDALDACLGRVRGRLSYLTVAGGTVFAALSGSSMASTAVLGTLLVPEMNRRGYKRYMSIGPVLGAGGLAILIPPSALAVLLGSLAMLDIGALLIAGVIPGLALAILYAVMIYVQLKLDPQAAPQYDMVRPPMAAVLRLIAQNIAPVSVIIFCVIGLIVLGIATPSESAAFGVLGVILLALAYRKLTKAAVVRSLNETVRVTGMVFLIVIASGTFSQILAYSGATQGIVNSVSGLGLAPLESLLIMFGILFVLGMFMDQVSMMLLTLPIFMPIAAAAGFDPIWFGVIVLITLEFSGITPPFGLQLYVMMGVMPGGASLLEVSRAGAPFLLCNLILVALLIVAPQIALFLPSLMKGG